MNEIYTKLAQRIVYSSMWEEDGDTCKVWITILALRDRDTGILDKNITGMARLAKLPIEKVEEAFAKFQAPDPRSTSDAFEGRRIQKVEGGWLVLNSDQYQEYGWSDEKRAKERERKARYRSRTTIPEQPPVPPVPPTPPATPPAPPAPPKEPKQGGYHKDSRTVLHTLNEFSGKHFREVDANLSVISARLSEDGVTLPGVGQMIRRQCAMWKSDAKMAEFLRPETLFGKSKFDSYYAAKDMPVRTATADSNDRNANNANRFTPPGSFDGVGSPEWNQQRREREAQEAAEKAAQRATQ